MTRQPASADHRRHDLELIAAHAAGDASTADAARAEALLAACPDCRQVAADLASIAAATRSLPALPRSRDFRISPEAAARLRPAGLLWRVVAGLLGPRGYGRPLAGALMTLGLAGLLVSALPAGLLGGAASAPATSGERDVATPTGVNNYGASSAPEAAGPSSGPALDGGQGTSGSSKQSNGGTPKPGESAVPAFGPVPGATAPVGDDSAANPPDHAGGATPAPVQAGGGPTAAGGEPAPVPEGAAGMPGPSPLVVASLVLLGGGIALLLARAAVPRVGRGRRD